MCYDSSLSHWSVIPDRSRPWLEEHHVDASDSIEIPELVDQFPNTCCGTLTEDRFETPLTLVHVLGRPDDVLELVLNGMELADNERVFVIER